jgi:hypothetical protein
MKIQMNFAAADNSHVAIAGVSIPDASLIPNVGDQVLEAGTTWRKVLGRNFSFMSDFVNVIVVLE